MLVLPVVIAGAISVTLVELLLDNLTIPLFGAGITILAAFYRGMLQITIRVNAYRLGHCTK